MSTDIKDQWLSDDIAAKYLRAEAATKPYAEVMMQKAGVSDFTGEEVVFDAATGTGAVVAALYEALGPEKKDDLKVVAGDISEAMMAYARQRAEKGGWKGVEFRNIDGVNVGTDETFTHIFINFAIFVFPSDSVEACAKLLRPNGFLAFTTWTYMPWYSLVVRAHARLTNAPPLPSHDEIKLMIYQGRAGDEKYVRDELEQAGFKDIEIIEKKETVNCGTPATYADTMTMPMKIVTMFWPEEDRARLHKEICEALEAVAEEEAGGKDGSFELTFDGLIGIGRKS